MELQTEEEEQRSKTVSRHVKRAPSGQIKTYQHKHYIPPDERLQMLIGYHNSFFPVSANPRVKTPTLRLREAVVG